MAKILLVEDDPSLRQVLARALLKGGSNQVQGAQDGAEALALLRTGKFDVIVTDVEMPKMNGIELVERLGEVGHYGAVLVMSGMVPTELEDRLQALIDERRIQEFLTKPCTSEMREAVARALAHMRERAQIG